MLSQSFRRTMARTGIAAGTAGFAAAGFHCFRICSDFGASLVPKVDLTSTYLEVVGNSSTYKESHKPLVYSDYGPVYSDIISSLRTVLEQEPRAQELAKLLQAGAVSLGVMQSSEEREIGFYAQGGRIFFDELLVRECYDFLRARNLEHAASCDLIVIIAEEPALRRQLSASVDPRAPLGIELLGAFRGLHDRREYEKVRQFFKDALADVGRIDSQKP